MYVVGTLSTTTEILAEDGIDVEPSRTNTKDEVVLDAIMSIKRYVTLSCIPWIKACPVL